MSARAKDDSLFAIIDGVVRFEDKGAKGRFISVLRLEEVRRRLRREEACRTLRPINPVRTSASAASLIAWLSKHGLA